MAAVTIVRGRSTVMGSKRVWVGTVTVATSGDTLAVPNMKIIDAVVTTPATAIVNGTTKSGATVTFLSAASNPTEVVVIGN